MSSLTTLGINKNKKGFAPKINAKRNVRKSATVPTDKAKEKPTENVIEKQAEKAPAPVATTVMTESSLASMTATAETVNSTSTSIQVVTSSVTTTTTQRKERVREVTLAQSNSTSSISSNEAATVITAAKPEPIAKAKKSKPKAVPVAKASTQTNEEVDSNGLTQEEIEMNAIAASRRRNKKLMSASSPLPISASSPISAPSPMAPVLDRSDCAFERNKAPVLKIERITPGLDPRGKSMSRPLKAESDEEEEDDTKILASAPIASVPSSSMDFDAGSSMDFDDMDFDIPSSTRDAASPPQSPTPTPAPSSPTPPPPTRTSTRKNKGKGKAMDDDFFEPKESAPAKKSRATKMSKASKASSLKAITPSKSSAAPKTKTAKSSRTKTGTSSNSSGTGISVPSSSSKGVAISIGAPSALPTETEDEEEGSSSRKKRKSGVDKRKNPDRFAYRLPENLKTLDDITNDPARVENLEKPMSDFTKDIDGIVSKNFKELEAARYAAKRKLEEAANMTPEELEALKEKEKEEEEIAKRKRKIAKEKEEERRKREAESSVLAESSNALQVRLVNGQIVLDTDSLTIERTEAERDYGDGAMEVVEENSMSRKVNSQTYGKRKQSSRWNDMETEQFYDCLSQFGTDFEMISMVMPGRTRAQIRTKFNREERICPEKVTEYLIRKKKPLDLAKYQEVAGIELEAVPDDFHEMQLA